MKKINSNPLQLEEVFLDDLVRQKEEDLELARRKIESPLQKRIFYLFSVFGLCLLLFLALAAFNLQVVNFDRYRVLAEGNRFLRLKIESERGIIFDRNKKQLTFNKAIFNLWARVGELPVEEKSREWVLSQTAEILGTRADELRRKIEEGSEGSVLLSQNLSHQQLILFETRAGDLPGIKVKKQIKRTYFNEPSLSHILGYLGRISPRELADLDQGYEIEDYVGKEGLEKEYEKVLAEKKGVLEIERDVRGQQISKQIKKEPRSGDDLILNLDLGLQQKVSRVLKEIIDSGKAKAGGAIALDPQTGGVLASVSLPAFDNNLFAKGISSADLERLNRDPNNPQLNRVVGGNYPVGSTIKPLIGLAGLEEGIITEKTSFFCPAELCLENKFTKELECFSDWTFHGWTDIRRAIAESVNPFFYIIGGGYERPSGQRVDSRLPRSFKGLGSRKIEEWLEKFGWGGLTRIDLPGEVAGRVPSPDWKEKYFAGRGRAAQKWYLGDTYNLAIGQGYILATPLQVAVGFQAIANGRGEIYQPRLVKAIVFPGQERKLSPKPLKNILAKKSNIEIIRQGMRQAVTSPAGSAHLLAGLPVSTAAKTGTAQTGRKGLYHNWITVFAPYEKPRIVITIMLENVKGLKRIAQDAAYDILQYYFSQD